MTSRADMAWNLPIMLMWRSAFLQNNTHQIITSERQQLVPLLNNDYWDVQILLTNGFSAASKVSFPVNGDHYCLSFFGKV